MGQSEGKQTDCPEPSVFFSQHMKRLEAVKGVGDFRMQGVLVAVAAVSFASAATVVAVASSLAVTSTFFGSFPVAVAVLSIFPASTSFWVTVYS